MANPAAPASSAATGPGRPLRRVLIANRGEIAVRVIRACQQAGLETVVVTSTADRDALPARLAAPAVCIGPPPAPQSYLAVNSVLSAALGTGCDAVHPGYGFLSENPAFAAACVDAGLTFVGPHPAAVAQAGDKARARELARRAGLPTLDGSPVLDDVQAAIQAADQLGYPVLIKAAAGGGGRGMSVVEDEADAPRTLAPRPGPRPPPRSAMGGCTWSGSSAGPGTSRCRSSATGMGSRSIWGSATAPCSAGTRRWSRNHQPLACPNRPEPPSGPAASRSPGPWTWTARARSSSSTTRTRRTTPSWSSTRGSRSSTP